MVQVKGLSLAYPGQDKSLEGIDIQLAAGECLLLAGQSGCGKSSILRSLNGLAHHYDRASLSGDICLDGQSVKGMEVYQIAEWIASVFQNPKTHFFNVDTTLELVFYLENKGVARQQIQDRLNEMLALFPIRHLLDRDIFRLSGGEKQVLSLAAAYISGTPIITLDEPSSNLDDRYTRVLSNMLQILKARGVTLIIAEHRIHYLMSVVDWVCLIEGGRMVETYSAEAFIELSEEDRQAKGLRSPVDTPLKRVQPLQATGDLTVKGLRHYFKGTGTGFAIQGLGLDRGCIYGIIGHNGAGKSTFLRALLGLEGDRGNAVYFNGKRLSKRQRLALSALVMQDVNHQLFTETVDKEVSLGLKNIDKADQGRILDQLGLARLTDRHPMSLSGGEKQRVAIASALLSDRPIIAFDEPTSGMDWHHMIDLSQLIKALAHQGKIVLVISHDKEFLNRTADRFINMEDYAL